MAYGWSNTETWNFINWFGDILTDMVDYEYQEMFAESEPDAVADYLESTFYKMSGIEEMPIGFAQDAAMEAWSAINWHEIAISCHKIANSYQSELEEIEEE